MPVGNAGKRPPLSAEVTGIPPRSGVASATANPSTLTRLFRRIKDRVFAMGHVTRILWLAPRRYVRCGQSHAVVCGVGGRRQNKCGGEYKRGQPPAFGRAGNTTNVCLLVVLPPAVVSRVSVALTPVRALPATSLRSSPFKSVQVRSGRSFAQRQLADSPACPPRRFGLPRKKTALRIAAERRCRVPMTGSLLVVSVSGGAEDLKTGFF